MISKTKIDEAVRALFDSIQFKDEPDGLYAPMRYMLSLGGKRLRPRLTLMVYGLFREDFSSEVLSAAAAMELFHSSLLLHDDILDRSALRRGQATVWKKWTGDTAILSGDAMFTDSLRRLTGVRPEVLPALLRLFTDTSAEVLEGQQYDLDFVQRDDVTMNEYLRMTGLKTSALLGCSAKMGAILGDASRDQADALYRYAYLLGLAFQIADDWLDSYGDVSVFGKPVGGDIVNSKKTWLSLRAAEKDPGATAAAFSLPSSTEVEKSVKVRSVRNLYDSLGISSEARAEIERFTAGALREAASVFPEGSEEYDLLSAFASSLIGRTR